MACHSNRQPAFQKVPPLQKSLKAMLGVLIDDADDELTACDLKGILFMTFGADNVQYGERTIRRIHNELGWT